MLFGLVILNWFESLLLFNNIITTVNLFTTVQPPRHKFVSQITHIRFKMFHICVFQLSYVSSFALPFALAQQTKLNFQPKLNDGSEILQYTIVLEFYLWRVFISSDNETNKKKICFVTYHAGVYLLFITWQGICNMHRKCEHQQHQQHAANTLFE